jgi:hypothetical protein
VIQPQAVMETACPGTLYFHGARVPLGQYLMLWTLSDRRLSARVQYLVCSVSLAIASLQSTTSGARLYPTLHWHREPWPRQAVSLRLLQLFNVEPPELNSIQLYTAIKSHAIGGRSLYGSCSPLSWYHRLSGRSNSALLVGVTYSAEDISTMLGRR